MAFAISPELDVWLDLGLGFWEVSVGFDDGIVAERSVCVRCVLRNYEECEVFLSFWTTRSDEMVPKESNHFYILIPKCYGVKKIFSFGTAGERLALFSYSL